jgi:hypothetical protein
VPAAGRWLLLMHQLPSKPAYQRVKIWRRLHGLGAVAVKHSVYALPAGEQAQEDFAWLLREIEAAGGEGLIWEARLIDGLREGELRGLFDAAREAEYDALVKDMRALEGGFGTAPPPAGELSTRLARFRTSLDQIVALDFFGAPGRETAEALLGGLERRLEEREQTVMNEANIAGPEHAMRGRVWVTRAGVRVDRIASAWLVRRFIDPAASFKFVPAKGYVPAPGELRFDMFEAEFTHEGDRCTFEVLLARAGLGAPALAEIGQIVHDIDLKDAKFGRAEAAGIARMIEGIAAATEDDSERIARGAALFDSLYAAFGGGGSSA